MGDVPGKLPLIPWGDCFDPDGPLWEAYRRTEHVFMADSAPLDPALALALAEQGLGAVLLPATATDRVPAKRKLRYIPLADGPHRTVTLLYAKEAERSAALNDLVGFIAEYARGRQEDASA